MEKPFKKIQDLLKEELFEYELLEHEPVFTSEQAACIRSTNMDEGAKSLLLKLKNEFVLVVVPGGSRLSMKKLRKHTCDNKSRFARPEEVIDIMGCEIGACYPVGSIIPIRTIVDPTFGKGEYIAFNPGVHDRTIRMKWEDYKKMGEWEIVDVME
ncbi:MAG: hypothetical protein KAR24_01440 [Candidatus Pacebacteria bacterium]|nr:hypothetical protein [Candidatus Paceibacterota bacterium]